MNVNVDLDFVLLMENGEPGQPAYEAIAELMPQTIAAYRANGQTQLADWLEDAMNQFNESRSAQLFDQQYFFVMSYADFGSKFTTYTKAQILKRFIP